MKKYGEYTLTDFLLDEFFMEWVKNPNESSNRYWKRVLEIFPEQAENIAGARGLVVSLAYKDEHRLDDEEHDELLHAIVNTNTDSSTITWNWPAKLAAAVFIALIGAISVIYFQGNSISSSFSDESWVTISTDLGQKRTIRLTDGTSVKLNSGSAISFPNRFDGPSREVKLVGEAFFDVARDTLKPFIIYSGDLTTQVLGTSFDIKAYEDDSLIYVGVVSGKVYIASNSGFSELLNVNDLGLFHQDQRITKTKFDSRLFTAWKEGTLIFENQPLPVIFDQLEKWYGINIAVDDDVDLSGLYSGEYHNKSLQLVLEGIGYTSGFKYDISKDKNNVKIKNK